MELELYMIAVAEGAHAIVGTQLTAAGLGKSGAV